MAAGSDMEAFDRIRDAWHWWIEELSALLPRRIADFFAAGKSVLRVQTDDNETRFTLYTAGHSEFVGAVDLLTVTDEELLTFSRKILSRLAAEPRVEYLPDKADFLTQVVYLPLAVERNLDSVLTYEVDKLTPFKKGEALFGYRVLERYPEDDSLAVELHAVAKRLVSPFLRKLKTMMLAPSAVWAPDDYASIDIVHTMNVLPPPERKVEEPLWNIDARRAALITAALLIASLALPAWYLNGTVEGINELIEEKRLEANRVAEKRGLITNQLLAQQAVIQRKNGTPEKSALLLEVTRLLPEDTWVSQLRVTADKLLIQGDSGKASDLIEIVEQSNLFEGVRFRSSITYDPRTGEEKYEIEADLEGVQR